MGEIMENKHTSLDLKQMQSLPLDIKITMSKRRIREWYEAWGGKSMLALAEERIVQYYYI